MKTEEELGSQVNAADIVGTQHDSLVGFPKTVTHSHNSSPAVVSTITNPPRTAPFRKLEPLLIGLLRNTLGGLDFSYWTTDIFVSFGAQKTGSTTGLELSKLWQWHLNKNTKLIIIIMQRKTS